MGVGAGLCMYDVIVKKFTFAISSPDEFFVTTYCEIRRISLPNGPENSYTVRHSFFAYVKKRALNYGISAAQR